MTDPALGTAEDRFLVEVVRRNTGLDLEPVADDTAGGPHTVAATLADLFGPVPSMAGRTITFRRDGAVATAVTDISGRAVATLDFGAGGPAVITASFDGDSHYNPSRDEETLPAAPPPLHRGNCGTDFWVAFHDPCSSPGLNCPGVGVGPLSREIFVTGEAHTIVRV